MKSKFSRREALQLGLGAAVLGACSQALPASKAEPKSDQEEGNRVATVCEFNKYGEELENAMILRTSPIAVKMLEKEADIPKEAIRPKKDRKYHIAQCQAFAMSRREGTTVAMLKEDHWCPTALMAYGMVEKPDSMAKFGGESYLSFEVGKYIGVVTAPLKSATFTPDVVLVYSNPAQLRGLLLTMMSDGASQVSGHFFLPSCGHCVVDPIKTKKYGIVLPDPGEYQRALTLEEEIIFAVPQEKMPGLMAGLKRGSRVYSHRDQHMSMLPDFEQPQFYKDLFKSWGLDTK